MLRKITALFAALIMAAVLALSAAPAHAAGGYWGGNVKCTYGYKNINVRICTGVTWYHDNSWRASTVKVTDMRVYLVGDLKTLEGKKSAFVNDPALVAGGTKVLKRYSDFYFHVDNRNTKRVYKPNVLVNKKYAYAGHTFVLRNNGGADSTGALLTRVVK